LTLDIVTNTLPAAFEGPYTDDLIGVGIYRLAGHIHFNDANRNQHALRWKDTIIKRINKCDFEPDGDIDFADFLYKWIEIDCGSCNYADLNADEKV
jgi:hypothetical protein